MSGWHNTSQELPPEDALVEVPNNGGTELRYHRGLWFFPDMSMYVYYTPDYWRLVDA